MPRLLILVFSLLTLSHYAHTQTRNFEVYSLRILSRNSLDLVKAGREFDFELFRASLGGQLPRGLEVSQTVTFGGQAFFRRPERAYFNKFALPVSPEGTLRIMRDGTLSFKELALLKAGGHRPLNIHRLRPEPTENSGFRVDRAVLRASLQSDFNETLLEFNNSHEVLLANFVGMEKENQIQVWNQTLDLGSDLNCLMASPQVLHCEVEFILSETGLIPAGANWSIDALAALN